MATRWVTGLCMMMTVLTASIEGLKMVPCTSNGTTQVEEDSQDFLLTCDDLDISQETVWKYQDRYPSSPETVISNCSYNSCSWQYSSMIQTTINPHTKSSHVVIPNVLRGRFPDGTWSCENGGQIVQCAVDVVYKANGVQCQVTVNEEKSMVAGECQIPKTFSSEGHYACQWFEANDNQAETPIPTADTQLSLSDCSVGSMQYMCGNCSFSKSLPSTSASYGYRVVVSPEPQSTFIRYTVVSAQSASTGSVPSSAVVTSPQMGGNSQTTSTTGPVVVDGTVPADDETTARFEGIGIGAAVLLALVLIVFLVVKLVFCCRRRYCPRKKKYCGDTFDDLAKGESMQPEKNGHKVSHGKSHPVPSDPSQRRSEVVSGLKENSEYSSIALTSIDETATYLHPLKPPDSTKQDMNPAINGGPSKRTLPAVPAESAFQIDTSGYETPFVTGNQKPEVRRHLDKGCWGDYRQEGVTGEAQSRPSYEPLSAPMRENEKTLHIGDPSLSVPQGDGEKVAGKREQDEPMAGRDGQLEEGEGEETEEKDNRQNEVSEKAAAIFNPSGFQEKGADYIYFDTSAIGLTKPI